MSVRAHVSRCSRWTTRVSAHASPCPHRTFCRTRAPDGACVELCSRQTALAWIVLASATALTPATLVSPVLASDTLASAALVSGSLALAAHPPATLVSAVLTSDTLASAALALGHSRVGRSYACYFRVGCPRVGRSCAGHPRVGALPSGCPRAGRDARAGLSSRWSAFVWDCAWVGLCLRWVGSRLS